MAISGYLFGRSPSRFWFVIGLLVAHDGQPANQMYVLAFNRWQRKRWLERLQTDSLSFLDCQRAGKTGQ